MMRVGGGGTGAAGRGRKRRPLPGSRPRGFALVAAAALLCALALLAGVALPHPDAALRLDRDAEYAAALQEYSVAVSRYMWLNKRHPAALEDLSRAAPPVLRRVVRDPATGRFDTWALVPGPDGRPRVATTSGARSADGTPYADWWVDGKRLLRKTAARP